MGLYIIGLNYYMQTFFFCGKSFFSVSETIGGRLKRSPTTGEWSWSDELFAGVVVLWCLEVLEETDIGPIEFSAPS